MQLSQDLSPNYLKSSSNKLGPIVSDRRRQNKSFQLDPHNEFGENEIMKSELSSQYSESDDFNDLDESASMMGADQYSSGSGHLLKPRLHGGERLSSGSDTGPGANNLQDGASELSADSRLLEFHELENRARHGVMDSDLSQSDLEEDNFENKREVQFDFNDPDQGRQLYTDLIKNQYSPSPDDRNEVFNEPSNDNFNVPRSVFTAPHSHMYDPIDEVTEEEFTEEETAASDTQNARDRYLDNYSPVQPNAKYSGQKFQSSANGNHSPLDFDVESETRFEDDYGKSFTDEPTYNEYDASPFPTRKTFSPPQNSHTQRELPPRQPENFEDVYKETPDSMDDNEIASINSRKLNDSSPILLQHSEERNRDSTDFEVENLNRDSKVKNVTNSNQDNSPENPPKPLSYGSDNNTTPTNDLLDDDDDEDEIVRVIRVDGQFTQMRGHQNEQLEIVNPYKPDPEYDVDPIKVHDNLLNSGKYGDIDNYREVMRTTPVRNVENGKQTSGADSKNVVSQEDSFNANPILSSTPISTNNWRSRSRASTNSNISSDTVKHRTLLANQRAANSPVVNKQLISSPVTNSIREEYDVKSPPTDLLPLEIKRSRSRQEVAKWLETVDDSSPHNIAGPQQNLRQLHDSPASNSKSMTSPSQEAFTIKSPINPRLEPNESPTGSRKHFSSTESKQSLKQKLEKEQEARKQQDNYISHLQIFYSSLLEKHALAEVTIDQLRLRSKTSFDTIFIKGRREPGDSDTLRTRSAMSRPLSQQIDSPFDSSMHGITTRSPFLDGHYRSMSTTPQFIGNTWEGAKLGVMLQMNDLQDGLDHLERCLSVLSQTWSEEDSDKQQKLCKFLREKYDAVQNEFKTAGQMFHESSKQESQAGQDDVAPFDPDGVLQSKLFDFGLRLDDFDTEISKQVRLNKRRTPFRSPELDSTDGSRNRRASMPSALSGRMVDTDGRLSSLDSPYLRDDPKFTAANVSHLENTFQDLMKRYEDSLDDKTQITDQEVENLISQLRDISIRANGKSEVIQTPQTLEEKFSRDRDTINARRPSDTNRLDKFGASDSDKSNASGKKRGDIGLADSGLSSRLSNQKSLRHPRGGDTNSSIADDSGIVSAADTNPSRRPGERLGNYGHRMKVPPHYPVPPPNPEAESGGSSSSQQGDRSSSSRLRNQETRRGLRHDTTLQDHRDTASPNKDEEDEPEIEATRTSSKYSGRSAAKGGPGLRAKRLTPSGGVGGSKLRSGRVSSSLASLRVTPGGDRGEIVGLPSLPAAAEQLPLNMRRMSKRSDSQDGSRDRRVKRQGGRNGSTTSHDSARSDRIRDLEEEVRHLKEQLGTGASEMSYDDRSSLNLEQYDVYDDGAMHSDEDNYHPVRGKSYRDDTRGSTGQTQLDKRRRSPDHRYDRRERYPDETVGNDIDAPIKEKRIGRSQKAPRYRGRELYSDEEEQLSQTSDRRRGNYSKHRNRQITSDEDTEEEEEEDVQVGRSRVRTLPQKRQTRQRTRSQDKSSQTHRSKSAEKGVNVRLVKKVHHLWSSDDDSLSDDITTDYEYQSLPPARLHRIRHASPVPPNRSILRTNRYASPPTPALVRHSYASSPVRPSSIVPCSNCGGSGLLEEELGLYSASGGQPVMSADLALPLREYRTQNQLQNYYVREYGAASTPVRGGPALSLEPGRHYDVVPETRLYSRRRKRSNSLPRKPRISAEYYTYGDEDVLSQRMMRDSLDIALKTARSMNRLTTKLRKNVKRDIQSTGRHFSSTEYL